LGFCGKKPPFENFFKKKSKRAFEKLATIFTPRAIFLPRAGLAGFRAGTRPYLLTVYKAGY